MLNFREQIAGVTVAALEAIMGSHGWINLAPFQKQEHGFTYTANLGEAYPTTITISIKQGALWVETDRSLKESEAACVKRIVDRMLSLDFPIQEFKKLCRAKNRNDLLSLASQGWGRMLRSPNAWEDACKTLLTTNASWNHTRKMCLNMCDGLGSTSLSGHMAFPTPARVRAIYPSLLREFGLGYRADPIYCSRRKALWLRFSRMIVVCNVSWVGVAFSRASRLFTAMSSMQ